MGRSTKKFDASTLPLPVHPGEEVYLLGEDKEVKETIATSVGFNQKDRVIVECGGTKYEVGTEKGAFLSAEDARQYLEDPQNLPEDYGLVDYEGMESPYYPGDYVYFCDYNAIFIRWEILQDEIEYVLFDEDGNVRVGMQGDECTLIGNKDRLYFDTLRKAQNFIRKQMS